MGESPNYQLITKQKTRLSQSGFVFKTVNEHLPSANDLISVVFRLKRPFFTYT